MGTCQALRPGGGRTGRTGTQIQQGSLRVPQSGLPPPVMFPRKGWRGGVASGGEPPRSHSLWAPCRLSA